MNEIKKTNKKNPKKYKALIKSNKYVKALEQHVNKIT
jgi:hypothetical protein